MRENSPEDSVSQIKESPWVPKTLIFNFLLKFPSKMSLILQQRNAYITRAMKAHWPNAG